MKLYAILVFGLLLTYIKSTCTTVDNSLRSVKDCGKLDSTEKNNGKTHCCFAQTGEIKVCAAYDDEEYEESKGGIGSVVNDGITYKFECDLKYIKLGLLQLIFFALWI